MSADGTVCIIVAVWFSPHICKHLTNAHIASRAGLNSKCMSCVCISAFLHVLRVHMSILCFMYVCTYVCSLNVNVQCMRVRVSVNVYVHCSN